MKLAGIGDLAHYVLSSHHTLSEADLGADACLARWGIRLRTKAWDVEGVGHLCAMHMVALGGIMRMETVIISPMWVDAPLMNLDYVNVLGKETQIVEFYDTQLEPWSKACQDELALIGQRDADMPNVHASEEHWYDRILYPCSYGKCARGEGRRLSDAATDYLVAFVDQLDEAPSCDESQKAAKVNAFAERLFEQGGPSVDMVTGLFGPDIARRLIVEHMYGAKGTEQGGSLE